MKAIILSLVMLLLLAGCGAETPETVSSEAGGYATDMLEYAPAEKSEFTLKEESLSLAIGDSIGGYKLEELLSRTTEENFTNIKAKFSCEIELSGTIKYNMNNTYKNLILFYPDDTSVFPRAKGDTEPMSWVVVLNEGDPMAALGFSPGVAAEKKLTLTMTSYSTNYMQHNTINYITIKIGE